MAIELTPEGRDRVTAWQVGGMACAKALRWERHVTFLLGLEETECREWSEMRPEGLAGPHYAGPCGPQCWPLN